MNGILDENHPVAIAEGSRLLRGTREAEKVNEEKHLCMIRRDRRRIDVVPIGTEVFQYGIESQAYGELTNQAQYRIAKVPGCPQCQRGGLRLSQHRIDARGQGVGSPSEQTDDPVLLGGPPGSRRRTHDQASDDRSGLGQWGEY